MVSRTALVALVAACVVSVAGSFVGLAFTDAGDDALQAGYGVTLALALIGLASTVFASERRRRVIGSAQLDAERALGILASRQWEEHPAVAASWLLDELLREQHERRRWSPEYESLRFELLDRLSELGVEEVAEQRSRVEWAAWVLASAGATREAEQLAARLAAVYYGPRGQHPPESRG